MGRAARVPFGIRPKSLARPAELTGPKIPAQIRSDAPRQKSAFRIWDLYAMALVRGEDEFKSLVALKFRHADFRRAARIAARENIPCDVPGDHTLIVLRTDRSAFKDLHPTASPVLLVRDFTKGLPPRCPRCSTS